MHINELRTDILEEIFSYLSIKEKFQCQLVCNHWQEHVFSPIKTITSNKDPYLHCRTHFCKRGNQLSLEDLQNEETMKLIFSKCGAYLLSFQGYINPAIVQLISEHCVKLHCVDLNFIGKETFKLFCDTCLCMTTTGNATLGVQLTCAAVSGDLTSGLSCFIAKCPNLKSLLISSNDLFLVKLPLNLEHLHISLGCEEMESNENGAGVVLLFKSVLHKLKSLNISLQKVCISKIKPILVCISNFPKVEEFSLCFDEFDYDDDYVDANDYDDYGYEIADKYFQPLLLMTNLKKLALKIGDELKLSDSFYSELFTKLPKLTSLGGRMWHGNDYHYSVLPNGSKFWRTVECRALFRPLEHIHLAGETTNDLNLCEPLLPNVTLSLEGACKVILSNGFGQSDHWRKLAEQSRHLNILTIEIQDKNFNLSGWPKSVNTLTVLCLNETKNPNYSALLFDTWLPNLKSLRVFQKTMTNQQLQAMLVCITAQCPHLENLCLGRDNSVDEAIDEYTNCVLERESLISVCVNENLVYNNEFKSKLRANGKQLKRTFPLGMMVLGFNLGLGNSHCACFLPV